MSTLHECIANCVIYNTIAHLFSEVSRMSLDRLADEPPTTA